MEDKELLNEELQEQKQRQSYMIRFYIALGCFIVATILLALTLVFTFAIKNGTAIYFLIASLVSSLAAVSFLNRMKQLGGEGKLRTIFVVLSYVVMIIGLVIIIGGAVGVGIFKK